MSRSILDIKKGSIITRVCKAKPYRSDGDGDRSYIGDKLKFIGIANNQIYFQSLEPISICIFGAEKIFDISLDLFEFGWDYYIDPQTLLNSLDDKATLEIRLERALEAEDYLLAEKIRKQLNSEQ